MDDSALRREETILKRERCLIPSNRGSRLSFEDLTTTTQTKSDMGAAAVLATVPGLLNVNQRQLKLVL